MTPTALRALLAAALLLPVTLAAQEPRDSLPRYLLEGVTVTGRRAPERRADAPQSIDVVTATDLDRTLASDAADALKKDAALDVIQYPGLLSGVSIRGFRPQFSGLNPHTLILVDGRPAGVTNLATLTLGGVERIEVLKGPASALYGSGAMGGVVNVVTRRSTGAAGGSVEGGYGSFGTYRGTLAAGGALGGGLDFDLSLSTAGRDERYRTGGNRLLGGDAVLREVAGRSGVERLADRTADTTVSFAGYASRSGTFRLGYEVGDGWRVDARGGYFDADRVQSPGDLTSDFAFATLNDLERWTGEVGVTGTLRRQALSARVFAAREATDYYDDARQPSFVSFRSPTRWRGAQLQDVVTLGAHRLTLGLDHTAADADSRAFAAAGRPVAPYNPDSRISSSAAFGELRLGLLDERLVASLGGRLDRIDFRVKATPLLESARAGSETHSVFNPSAGLLYHAGGGVRAHATIGRAFVAPDAFSVAGYVERPVVGRRAVTVTRGNPELTPESGVTWDAGLGVSRPRAGLDADVTYFHTDVRDRVAAVPIAIRGVTLTAAGDTILGVLSYRNADRSEIRGLEARASYDLGALTRFDRSLRLFASGTRILSAEEVTAGERAPVTHVADLTAVFGVEYDDLRRASLRLSGRYVGERTAPDYNDFQNVSYLRYPEFLVLDATSSLRVHGRYRLGLAVENLTDENYYEVRGYVLPGRSLLVSLGVEF